MFSLGERQEDTILLGAMPLAQMHLLATKPLTKRNLYRNTATTIV
jgi:hypothetical protein